MRRDLLSILWRIFSSRTLALALLTVAILAVGLIAVFPQEPDGIAAGSTQYRQWQTEIRATYLQWAEVLQTLGVFDVFNSLWFRVALALLLIGLALCAVEQSRAISPWFPPSPQDFGWAFRQASQSRTFVISGTAPRPLGILRALLERHGYRLKINEADESSYLTASRFSFSEWGKLVAHCGLLVLIVSLLLATRFSWREDGIALSRGQDHLVQHAPSLSLRLDDFQVGLYPDGAARSYLAQLSLFDDGQQVAQGVAAPNVPFTYQGISFYQRSHGPDITLRGLDPDGEPIALQTLSPAGTLTDEASLQLSEASSEGYIAAPEQNLIFRLILDTHMPGENQSRPTVRLQAYRGGITDLTFSQAVSGSSSFQIGDCSYTLEWDHYATMTIARDPTFLPAILGAAALLVGAIVSLYVPARHIWGVASTQGDLLEIRLVRMHEQDKSGLLEFDDLMQEIEDCL